MGHPEDINSWKLKYLWVSGVCKAMSYDNIFILLRVFISIVNLC